MAGSSGRSLIAGPRDRVVVRMSLVLMLVLLVLGVSINVINAQNCGCDSGLCCSKWGYCGSTTAYCSDGCQSGPCYNSGGGSVANIVSRSFFDGLLNTPSLPNCGCANDLCCGKDGYCGTTSPYCGDGCQSGPCYNSSEGSPSGEGGNVVTIISQSFFDGLAGGAASSCEGKGFYTYNAFIVATNEYSGFGTTGADDVQKRELAAFFANVMHETGGLCSINEINPPQLYCNASYNAWSCTSGKSYHGRPRIYCDPSYTAWPCTSGKSYHGRGPLQLSWNYNYGAAGQNIGFDGLNNPEKVGQDATIAFKTAVWFWMQNSNCHSAITSGQGFGATIKAINSGECNGGKSGQVSSRVNYYNTICSQLGVDPGANVSC